MVKTWLRVAVIAALISSCTDNTTTEDAQEVTAGRTSSPELVTLADTSAAPTVSFAEAAGDSIFLRLKAGQKFRYRTSQYAEDSQDTLSIATSTSHVYTKTVRNVRPNGSYELEIVYNEIQSSGTFKNTEKNTIIRKEAFDSRDTAKVRDPRNAQFALLINAPVTVVMNPQARIEDITGVGPIVDNMIAKIPVPKDQQLPPGAKEEITRQVQTIMYASIVGQELVPYPSGPLDSSMTWVHEQTVPVSPMYSITTKANYRITQIKRVKGRRIATIQASFAGRVIASPMPPDAPATLKLDRSVITGDGMAVVDLENGATISKKNKVSISLSATVTEKATGKVSRINNTSIKRFDVELLP